VTGYSFNPCNKSLLSRGTLITSSRVITCRRSYWDTEFHVRYVDPDRMCDPRSLLYKGYQVKKSSSFNFSYSPGLGFQHLLTALMTLALRVSEIYFCHHHHHHHHHHLYHQRLYRLGLRMLISVILILLCALPSWSLCRILQS
jgi:hypothetical protein